MTPPHIADDETSGEKLPTKKQVVAGFVVYRKTTDGIKFLMLYRRGNYWNFPKGHFKPGERTIDAALRELEEETGIKKSELRIVPNFRGYERFFFKIGNQGIYDTVIPIGRRKRGRRKKPRNAVFFVSGRLLLSSQRRLGSVL